MWGGFIEGSRHLHIKRFARPLVVERLTKASEALLLRAAVGPLGGVWFRLSGSDACVHDVHFVEVCPAGGIPGGCRVGPTTLRVATV